MDLGLGGRRALVGGGAGGIGAGIAGVLAAEGARLVLAGRTAETLDARAAELGAGTVVADLSTPDGPAARSRPPSSSSVDSTCSWSTPAARPPAPSRPSARRNGPAPSMARCTPRCGSSAPRCHTCARGATRPSSSTSARRSASPARAHHQQCAATRPGRPDQEPELRDRPDPHQRRGPRPLRHRPRPAARRRACGVDRPAVEEVQRQAEATIPLGRYGDTAEIGRVAAFLLSPAASYVTGAIVPVDGGLVSALP